MAMPDRVAHWTLAELHRLPDDGNRYEIVRGALFVTPPPSWEHQRLASLLAARLQPYVAAHGLGSVCFPRSVIRLGTDDEVEPDLMVRPVPETPPTRWDDAPLPILVVEVVSDTTRRRDRVEKRRLYRDAAIPDYWIVDSEIRTIRVVRPGLDDVDVTDALVWHPLGASEPFMLDVAGLFAEAAGRV
jgi:Uma2 family endonuclease